jgi:hypothetical protein
MALFEIEDQYLPQLQNLGVPVADRTRTYQEALQHQEFVQRASQDPKYRDTMLEAAEQAMGIKSPELQRVRQVREEVQNMLTERLKPLDDFLENQKKEKEEQKTRSVQQLVEQGRNYLREQGWDDEGVNEVESFMRENSVGSYKVASDYLKRQKPDPTPLPTTSWTGNDLGSSWFTPQEDDKDHELLLKNPRAFSQLQIKKFLREQQDGRR